MRNRFPLFPVRSFLLRALVILALMASALPVVNAAPGVPNLLHYQGRLLDDTGNLLGGSGTEYCFRFSFYDDATVGAPDTQLWPSATPGDMTVNVVNGVFAASIGDVSAGGDVLDYPFTDDTTYLNIEVATQVGGVCGGGDESYETLSPRQRINASGYAINAGSVFGTNQSAIGTTTPVDAAVLTVESTSTNSVGLAIRRFTGQIAHLFDVLTEFGQSLFTINENGNVGIGTSTPYAKLSVVGDVVAASFSATTSATSTFAGGIDANVLNVTATNASSTFANGIDLSGGCFSVGGVCLGGSSVDAISDLSDVDTTGAAFGNVLAWDGGNWVDTATSALAISTTDLVEGTNLFWTNDRFDARLSATSSLPDLNTLSGLASFGSSTATTTAEGNLHVLDTLQVGSGSLYLTQNGIHDSGALTISAGANNDITLSTSGSGDVNIGGGAFVYDGTTGQISVNTSDDLTLAKGFSASGSSTIASAITDANAAHLDFEKSRSGGGISSGDELGILDFSGFDGSNYNLGASLEAVTEGTIVVGQTPTSLRFSTEDLSGNFAERLRIAPGGNVGIGTTSPYEALSVAGTVVADVFNATDTNATSTFTGLEAGTLNITSTNASSTFANGIDITGGCFSVNGVCTTSNISYLGLTDTPSSFTNNAIQYANNGGTGIAQSSSLTFNGSILTAPQTNLTGLLTAQSGFISQASSTVAGDLTVTGNFALGVVNAASTTATSTFANGVRLTGGCFEDASGSCVQISTPVFDQFVNTTGGGDINAATATTVPFDSEDDTGNSIVGSSTDPSAIEFEEAGSYKISYTVAGMNTLTNATRANIECKIQANGSGTDVNPSKSYTYVRGQYDQYVTNSASFIYAAAANDYIQVFCERSPTTQQNPTVQLVSGESWLSVEKIGGSLGTGGGGSGGGTVAVEENDSTVVSSASSINFGGNDFSVTNAGGGKADIAVDYSNSGITRKSQNETISSTWNFLHASSSLFSVVDTLFVGGTATTTITGNNGTSTFAGGVEAAALDITSSATSTFANGLELSGGCVVVNGICLGSDANYLNLTDTPSSFAANAIPFANSSANALTQDSLFVFDGSNNRLGIGVASPQGIIDLYSETDSDLFFESAVNASDGSTLTFRKSREGGGTVSGDEVGTLSFQAFDGLSYNQAASLDVITEGTILVGQTPASVRLSTEDLSGNYAERLRVTPAGDVGIATTSPAARFTVEGDTFLSGDVIATGTLSANTLSVTATNASSTFANGIDLTTGCFSINGVCLGSSAVEQMSDLSDADTAGATYGNVLAYDGANWVDTATSALAIAISDTVGTLSADRGGTGLSTLTNNELLIGGPGDTVTQIATSSLGIRSMDVIEDTKLFYTNTRVENVIAASSTIVNLDCGTGQVAKADGVGGWNCQDDLTGAGAGGGSGLWATTTDSLTQYPTNPTRVVLIGGSATTSTGNIFEVIGSSLFDNVTVGGTLSVSGKGTLGLASSTALSASNGLFAGVSTHAAIYGDGATSTLTNGLDISDGCFAVNGECIISASNVALNDIQDVSLSSLSYGHLLMYNGANWVNIATSTLNVSLADTAGTLPVNRGGTGATSFSSGGFLFGNGTGALGASSSPTVGWITATSTTATSTFANGITLSSGCAEVNGECLTTTDQYTDLTDTPSSFTANAIQYANAGATALAQAATFVYDAANGRLGIGVSNPEAGLHLSSGQDASVILDSSTTTANASDITFRNSRGAGGIQSGDELGSLQFTGFDLGGYNTGAAIEVITEGSIAVGQTPASIRFSTDDLTGNYGERLRITPGGSVGIGTSSPYEMLSVAGGIVANYITATSTATSSFTGGVSANLLNITSSTASSTFANGIVLENGCVSANGTCIGTFYTDLADTPTTLTSNAIQFANSGGTAVTQNAGFTFNGTTLTAPGITVNSATALTVATAGATSTFAGFINVNGTNSTSTFAGNVSVGGNVDVSGRFDGAGLTDCTATTTKLQWNATTGQFECNNDEGSDQAIDAYDSTGGVAVTASRQTLNLDATNVQTSEFDLTNDEVTILQDGVYLFIAHLTVTNPDLTGSARAAMILNAQASTSPSGFQDISNGICRDYVRENANDLGASCTISWVASASAGDRYRLQHSKGDTTTMNTLAGGSGLTIVKISDETGADFAELYYTKDLSISSGEIVSVDDTSPVGVVRSTEPYQEDMIGVISTKPGQLIGNDQHFEDRAGVALALSGRVPLKVNGENGPIEPGDMITSSSIAGVGMKATKPGQVIGMALEGYTEEDAQLDEEAGIESKITVFVNPGWYGGDPERFADWFDLESLVVKDGESEEEITGVRKVVYEVLKSFGFVLEKGVGTLNQLFADRITVKNADIREAVLGSAKVGNLSIENSFEMTDQKTGNVFCMVLIDGVLTPEEGACAGSSDTDTETPALDTADATGEVPVITIQGNNPAYIEIGSEYADLGALVSDDRDNNLGITTLLDGVPVDSVSIDTSEAREYTVTYETTDNDGNTASEDRVVVVGEPGNDISDPVADPVADPEAVTEEDGIDPAITVEGTGGEEPSPEISEEIASEQTDAPEEGTTTPTEKTDTEVSAEDASVDETSAETGTEETVDEEQGGADPLSVTEDNSGA